MEETPISNTQNRETMAFDVAIVGAGPAGLSAAIRLKQLAQEKKCELSVCVLEKGSEVGAHILSGAVIEPRALNELIPDWKSKGAPLTTEATEDHFLLLTQSKSVRLPTPPQMHNQGNYIISLGNLCRWLAAQAEQLGVEIYPGIPAAQLAYDENGTVTGIITGDMGVNADGSHSDHYEPGMIIQAKTLLLSEGARGSLTEQVIKQFDLRKNSSPQTYGIGLKEIWEVDPGKHSSGKVMHSVGWPLDHNLYGGSFLYHWGDNKVSVGFVVGLDYKNPYLNPFEEFQRFKQHPSIRPLFENGKRIAYGSKALNEGGLQSIPKLTFPGGAIIGCAAGFLNVPKIKGIHTAMKSGMVAAESVIDALAKAQGENISPTKLDFDSRIKNTWVWDELTTARNIRPGFHWGLYPGLAHAVIDTYLFRGKAPWTFSHHEDHKRLKRATRCNPIEYPKPDGKISFDILSSVYLSNTNHEENQPCHLTLKNDQTPIRVNLVEYDAPETRYCPANVYEIIKDETGHAHLQINAQNCLHCKTCDIKDPEQNIVWVTPEGGGGPNYGEM